MILVHDLARSTAHALNNAVGTLFVAADSLEAPARDKSHARARAAVEGACASIRALAAALELLAIAPADVVAALERDAVDLEAEEVESMLEILHGVCGIETEGVLRGLPPLRTRLDRGTLQAVLVCACSEIRYAVGMAVPLRFEVRVEGGSVSAGGRLLFEVAVQGGNSQEVTKTAPVPAWRRHPCGLGLEHAAALLAPLGVSIGMESASSTLVIVSSEVDK